MNFLFFARVSNALNQKLCGKAAAFVTRSADRRQTDSGKPGIEYVVHTQNGEVLRNAQTAFENCLTRAESHVVASTNNGGKTKAMAFIQQLEH